MSSSIVRWGGWAGVVAAVTYVLASILILIAPLQRVFSFFGEHLIEVILVLQRVAVVLDHAVFLDAWVLL